MAIIPEKIVGIAGASNSGKSTLEQGLPQRVNKEMTIFPFDDLFVGTAALEGVVVEDWESPDLYRWEDLFRSLSELRLGRPVTIAAHSRESTEQGINRRLIKPGPIVVVAGFLALYDEGVRVQFDQTIYIDLPEDEIIRRRKARAEPDSPWDTDDYISNGLIPGHRRYVLPQRERADYIVDGTMSREQVADAVAAIINS